MKKQVVVIHGGATFTTHGEYLFFLFTSPIEIKALFRKDWKDGLVERLGSEYEVSAPHMPNKWNAKYEEWKIWFEKYIPFLRDDIVLVGHSMGGVFLVKYLSENSFPKKIKASFLVSAPYDNVEGEILPNFILPTSLDNFARQAGEIFLYHSKDDPVVDFGELAKYQKTLPNATVKVFENRGHFSDEDFPEIVSDIKSLA